LQVIDSRTFGHIPLSNIVGRVIYAASSRVDHAPVINNPVSVAADQPVIEGEVDVEKLFPN
jgi:inner membrane protease subunit 1